MDDQAARYLNVRETAARLGVHENTIRNWVRDGLLPTARLPGSKFHRFDEREVERLVRERGARVTSVKPDRRTIGPELVDATQLSAWGATRDSHDKFPELIRRLLYSTPGITDVSVRSGEGVAVGGWDGRADSSGTKTLPKGRLYFEFGVSARPRTKADEDYERRRADPGGADPVHATFVFITPRRWAGAAEWANARRNDGVFADVRVLDADDLEAWLQATPAVHHWISEELGRRPRDAETLEHWWERFRGQTVPVLPRELFLAGRETERDELGAFFGKSPDVIAVQAGWRDEAIAFVCATIDSLGSDDPVQPPLLVASAEVWDRVVEQPGRMTLLPLFGEANLTAALERGHHVVLPLGREEVVRGAKLELPRVHRQAAVDALQAAGIEFDHAYRLSALARRSMASLIRSLARDPRLSRPKWSMPPTVAVIAPLVLLGAWTASDDDHAVVARMTSMDWASIERTLLQWSTEDDPPFIRSANQWRLTSPEEAFLVLRDSITADDLVRWRDTAVDVLLELDPVLDLSADDRPLAGIRGISRHHSPVLRNGVAEGVSLVGSIDEYRLADGRSGADHARLVVQAVLRRANDDQSGRTWASLSDVLPLLAEAAPHAFLDAVHDDLDRKSPVLATMFQDHSQSSWLFSSSPHTGLLWALESLCWSPDFIIDAARALARLQRIDPGGRLANRPLESLMSVLVGWVRHTSANLQTRVQVLEVICKQAPDVAWTLLIGLWPENQSTASPPHSPRFRDWKPESRGVPLGEWADYIRHFVRLAGSLAGTDLERWGELAEHVSALPPSERQEMLASLAAVVAGTPESAEQRLALWERIQREIGRHRRFPDADWAMSDDTISELERIAAELEPQTAERFGYLFDWRPDLPDVNRSDYAAYDQKLRELRAAAVTDVLAEGGIQALGKLASRSPVGRQLGWTVGGVAGDDLTPGLLTWLDADDPKLRDVAAGWAGQRLQSEGSQWLRNVLSSGVLETAARRVAFVRQAPPTRDIWNVLDDLDPNLAAAYWEGMDPWRVAPTDADYAARRLLGHDRAWAAVDLLTSDQHQPSDGTSSVTVDLVTEVLDAAMASDPSKAPTQSLGYEIGLLLDFLEREGAAAGLLARYEFAFFRLLDHHRQPRALYAAMDEDPRLFVDLVKKVYRGKDEPRRQLDEHEAAMAHHAWWVLNHWRAVPGLQDDGSIDHKHLGRWVRQARLAFDNVDRADVGDEEIGRVLASSPPGRDGAWPPQPVREIIEAIGSRSLESGLHTGVINSRGTTTRGPYDGGQQERVIAQRYWEWSREAAGDYPRTSRLLRGLAEDYERDARLMDERAEIRADTD